MEKKLDIISNLQRSHQCSSPTCKKRIPAGDPAVLYTIKEVLDGKKRSFGSYFCSFDCYNDFEAAVKYGAGAATDSELVFN